MKGKDLRVAVLFDFYGEMLTDKQKDVIDLYYNEDLSLAEIAEHEGISRQGVRDLIKKAEEELFVLEDKLGLAQKFGKVRECADRLEALLDSCELPQGLHSELIALAEEIKNNT